MGAFEDANGAEHERLSGWPQDEDQVILRFLSDHCRSQVMARPLFGIPPGMRLGEIVDAQLERFYSLLAHGNTALKGVFSEEELLVVAEVLNGTIVDAEHLVQVAVFNLRDYLDSYREHIENFEVDGFQLLAKVELLDPLARGALVDVIERWWALDDAKRNNTSIVSLIDDAPDPKKFIHISL